MTSLEDKSLIRRMQHGETSRFIMLQTVRAFGFEQLVQSGEDTTTMRALVTWYLSALGSGFEKMFGPDQIEWLQLVDEETDNIRAGLAWALDNGEGRIAQQLAVAMSRFWYVRGFFVEGRSWFERALACGFTDNKSYGNALLGTGWMAFEQGDSARARELLEQSVELADSTVDHRWRAQALNVLGLILEDDGLFDRAITCYEESLAIYRANNDRIWPPFVLNCLGLAAFEQGDIDRAVPFFDQALAEFRAEGNTFGISIILMNLGKVARLRGAYGEAQKLFVQSLAFRWEQVDRPGILGCLRGLATVAVRTGDVARAARLFGAVEALRQEIGAFDPRHNQRYGETVAAAKAKLGESAFSDAWDAGYEAHLADVAAAVLAGDVATTNSEATARVIQRTGLTPREIEVLRLVRDGLSNRAIGERLFVSERTAQTHVQHILDKLDVSTRAEAAADAVERGLI